MDLRDLEFYGKKFSDFKEVTKQELYNLKNEATNWLNNPKSINPNTKKKPKGLLRWPGKRFVIHNGKALVLYKKGLNVEAMPFEKYMSNLTRASGIPKGVFSKLQSDSASLLNDIAPELGGKYPEGFEFKFKQWFKNFVVGQKSEQQFWRNLGQLYQDAGVTKDKHRSLLEVDRSHYWPHSKGGGPFTWLENWLVNQSRGSTPFTSQENLKKLGIPTTWEELIDTVYKQEELGQFGPLNQPIETISKYVPEALQRNVPPERIIDLQRQVDEIQNFALDNPDQITPELNTQYQELILEQRGPGNEIGTEGMEIDLKTDVEEIQSYMDQARVNQQIAEAERVSKNPIDSDNNLKFNNEGMKINADGTVSLERPNLINQMQIKGQNLLRKGGNYLKNEFGPGAAVDVGLNLLGNRQYEKRLLEGDTLGVGSDLAKDAVIGETIWGTGKTLLNKFAPNVLPTVATTMATPAMKYLALPTLGAGALLGLTARPAGDLRYENEMDNPAHKMMILDDLFPDDDD